MEIKSGMHSCLPIADHSDPTLPVAWRKKLNTRRSIQKGVPHIFGNELMRLVEYCCYKIKLLNLDSKFACNFTVLNKETIVVAVPAIITNCELQTN